MPVILATEEAEIREMVVQDKPQKKKCDPISKTPNT
jgi:hypothetical protein